MCWRRRRVLFSVRRTYYDRTHVYDTSAVLRFYPDTRLSAKRIEPKIYLTFFKPRFSVRVQYCLRCFANWLFVVFAHEKSPYFKLYGFWRVYTVYECSTSVFHEQRRISPLGTKEKCQWPQKLVVSNFTIRFFLSCAIRCKLKTINYLKIKTYVGILFKLIISVLMSSHQN